MYTCFHKLSCSKVSTLFVLNIVCVCNLCDGDKPVSQLHIATVRKYSNVHGMLGI